MSHSLTNNSQVNKGLTPKLVRLKASMRRSRVTYWQVAQASGLTDTYCWMVLNGRRHSVKVVETAERLIAEKKA
jgi:hypothetical protein